MKTTSTYSIITLAMLIAGPFALAQNLVSADTNTSRLVTANQNLLQQHSSADTNNIIATMAAGNMIPNDVASANGWHSNSNSSGKSFLDLNGVNEYAEGPQLLSGLGKATMMGWIKLGNPYNVNGYIMGQDVFNLKAIANGTNKKIVASTKTQTVTFSGNLVSDRWYHITAVYDNTATAKLKLFINGQYDANATISGNIVGNLDATTAKFTMGKNSVSENDYFKGAIDEVRVFNTALTDETIQKMVYQEIKQNGDAIRGEVIPKDIENTSWASLLAYYKMDDIEENIIANRITDAENIDAGTTFATIYNAHNFPPQSAPMPFVTKTSGSLEAAIGYGNFVNAADASTYSWSIVQVNHDININANLTTLGMIISPLATVSLLNDIKLENSWYLKLDGKLDLKGKSQLLQTINSDLDPTSIGTIERDQQGQSNKYNYNYWCSPVGMPSATTNNNPFTINEVLRDGTNPSNIQNITWSTGLDGAPTSPITLSGYWIFKFQNTTPVYANWSSVGPYGTLLSGQGFTLKGSGALTPTQNFTFTGKPNNGTINVPISAGNLNLTGNPYPSALDADAFIKANTTVINGTLYFWEHFTNNTSHNLADYQGGYGVRNLIGGVAPVVSLLATSATGSKMPNRFIPVGQGFFIAARVTGNIIFDNSQRKFIKESGNASNVLLRQDSSDPSSTRLNNREDTFTENTFSKIRLGFDCANFHRQVLIGFMNEYATSNVDIGYDALNIDTQTNDMYLMNGTSKIIIAGESYFDENKILPIGVKAYTNEPVSFMLDDTENFDADQPIYIHDNATNQYHNLRNGAFEISLPNGTVLNRFSLRFKNPDMLGNIAFGEEEHHISVAFTNNDNTINIANDKPDATVNSVQLFNMLGQNIDGWNVAGQTQTEIKIPIQNQSTGAYIVKVLTTDGDISKKIVIE